MPAVTEDNMVLIVHFDDEGHTVTLIGKPKHKLGHEDFGIVVADTVRHVARAFQVEEREVWRWVDQERAQPTSGIEVVIPGKPEEYRAMLAELVEWAARMGGFESRVWDRAKRLLEEAGP